MATQISDQGEYQILAPTLCEATGHWCGGPNVCDCINFTGPGGRKQAWYVNVDPMTGVAYTYDPDQFKTLPTVEDLGQIR